MSFIYEFVHTFAYIVVVVYARTLWIYFAAKYTYLKWHSKPIIPKTTHTTDRTIKFNGMRSAFFSLSLLLLLRLRLTLILMAFAGEFPNENLLICFVDFFFLRRLFTRIFLMSFEKVHFFCVYVCAMTIDCFCYRILMEFPLDEKTLFYFHILLFFFSRFFFFFVRLFAFSSHPDCIRSRTILIKFIKIWLIGI